MQEINFTKQKILLGVTVGSLVLVLVMLGVMFFGGKKNIRDKEQAQKINNEQGTQSSLDKEKQNNSMDKNNKSSIVTKKIIKLTAEKSYGLTVKKDTNLAMFYERKRILTVDPFSGRKNAVGGYPFEGVKKFLWNKNLDRALVEDATDYYVYDLSNNQVNKFRDKIDIATWNEDGNKIIYKYYNKSNGKREIRVVDVDGKNNQLIINNLPYRRIDLQIQPKNNRICYLPTPDARIKGKLFCSDLFGKNLKEYGGQFGQDYLWSPNGDKILTSFTKSEAGNQLVLGVMNKNGGEFKGLSFATTVKKCVWSKNNIDVYCAMIIGAPLDIMLPNGWEEQIFHSADTFWKINTTTGKKSRVLELEEIPTTIDAEDFVFDSEENFLFFRSRGDGGVWRIKIK